jgi:hypothetical protein
MLAGALAFVTIVWPGTVIDAIWRINPDGRAALSRLGGAAGLLMAVVCACCAAAAFGTWAGRRWGYLLALGMLAANFFGAIADAAFAHRPEALVGIPIVAALIAYLRRPATRAYFAQDRRLRTTV